MGQRKSGDQDFLICGYEEWQSEEEGGMLELNALLIILVLELPKAEGCSCHESMELTRMSKSCCSGLDVESCFVLPTIHPPTSLLLEINVIRILHIEMESNMHSMAVI